MQYFQKESLRNPVPYINYLDNKRSHPFLGILTILLKITVAQIGDNKLHLTHLSHKTSIHYETMHFFMDKMVKFSHGFAITSPRYLRFLSLNTGNRAVIVAILIPRENYYKSKFIRAF